MVVWQCYLWLSNGLACKLMNVISSDKTNHHSTPHVRVVTCDVDFIKHQWSPVTSVWSQVTSVITSDVSDHKWPQWLQVTSVITSDLSDHKWPQSSPVTSVITSDLSHHQWPVWSPVTSVIASDLSELCHDCVNNGYDVSFVLLSFENTWSNSLPWNSLVSGWHSQLGYPAGALLLIVLAMFRTVYVCPNFGISLWNKLVCRFDRIGDSSLACKCLYWWWLYIAT